MDITENDDDFWCMYPVKTVPKSDIEKWWHEEQKVITC